MSKIKKVLLIVPPAVTFIGARDINPLPPIGMGYLAAIGEKMGLEVRILDCLIRGWNREEKVSETLVRVGLSDEEIKRHISDFDPDVVGIGCSFSRQHELYLHVFDLVKRVNPEYITVAGGAHVTVCTEDILSHPACDFVIIGEGEESFKNLLMSLDLGRSMESIDGFGWKNNGKIVINPKTRWIEDLDSIPLPAYHVMELERYFALDVSHGVRHENRFCPIITSRGCPAKCTFCSAQRVWGNRYRTRSVGSVLEEMKLLKTRYGIKELMFEDDNVTADPNRAKELFSAMIREKLNFAWDTPNGVGVWSIDEAMLDLMKASGCVQLNFPVESGSQRVLREVIRKPLNLSRVRTLIAYCKEIRLDYGMFLVIGMPGETMAEMWETFLFAASCGVYNPHISVATPYPGTVLLETCLKNGYLENEFDFEDLFIKSFMIKTPSWNRGDLEKILLRGRLYLKFREAICDPVNFAFWLAKKMVKPRQLFAHIRKIVNTGLLT